MTREKSLITRPRQDQVWFVFGIKCNVTVISQGLSGNGSPTAGANETCSQDITVESLSDY